MKYKTIDCILGLIFLGDLCYWTYFLYYILFLGGGISSFYTGTALLLFLSRIALNYIAVLFVINLFFLNKQSVQWALLIFALLFFVIQPRWALEPNAPEYIEQMRMLEERANTQEETPATSETVVIDAGTSVYPSWPTKMFYIASLLYAFLLRPRLTPKPDNNVSESGSSRPGQGESAP